MDLKGLSFIKASGGGNDFILIDNRKQNIDNSVLIEAIPSICSRGLSVGADGVIILAEAHDADFDWSYFNSDGSYASLCINGVLSAVRACKYWGLRKSTFTFNTPSGKIKSKTKGNKIRLFLPSPRDIRLNQELSIESRNLNCHFINTGVPHAIVFHDNLEEIPVNELGEKVRNHKLFLPEGSNVDFVKIIGDSELSIRTYERGIEGETLSCGTGAFASAIIAVLLRLTQSPVKVCTKGGSRYTIDTLENYLEGEARLVYMGELQEALWQV